MTVGIVTVGRRAYVSGLYWENSPTGRISQAAKEAAQQPGNLSEFFVVRPGNKQGRVPQFGLAPSAPDFRSGMPSFAGCLANQQPGSWVGAFKMREGTALVIVRDDLIVPDGDLFFVDEAEARDRLYQELAIGGFQRIYAPEGWGVPDSDTMPISLLLNDRTDVRLRPVALSQQTRRGLLFAFICLVLLLGIGWYVQQKQAQEMAEEIARMEALQRANMQAQRLTPGMQKEPEYPPPERKWEKQPRPADIINACREGMKQVPLGIAGWSINSMRCESGSLTIRWGRSTGISAIIPRMVVEETGQAAALTVPFTNIKPRGDEVLVSHDEVSRRFLRQNWPGSMRREPDDPLPPPPPNYQGPWNPPPAPWVKRSFTVSVPVLPWTLPLLLEDLPGVVINSMVLNGTGTSDGSYWSVQGVIYENRQ